MPIDDHPLDALQKQLESEQRSSDPVLARLVDLLSSLRLPWPVDKSIRRFLARVNADRVEKIELAVSIIRDELKKHEGKLREIERSQPLFEEWVTLVVDGLKKAEQTRAKERVARIGRILAAAIVNVPTPKADDVEEMMRVAIELSDRDVQMLNELVRIEGVLLGNASAIPRYTAWNKWPQGSWGERVDGEIDTVFSKLESFGLVTRLVPPNNLNILADYQNRYSLLRKGLDFIRFVQR